MSAERAYLFRHALLRDAAYELQPPSERAALHRLALAAFEACLPAAALPAHALELAGHARLSEDLREAECRYLDLGYRHALARDQRGEAITALRRLAGLLPERSDARRAALYELAIHQSAVDPAAALPILDECERVSADEAYLGRVLRGRAMTLFSLQRREQARELLRRALHTHEHAGDDVELALTRNAFARIQLEDGRIEEAHVLLRRVLPVTGRMDDSRHHGGALVTLGMAASRLDRHREAESWFRQALEAHERVGPSRYLIASLQGLGRTLRRLDELREALAVLDRCIALCRKCGELGGECTTQYSRGEVLRRLDLEPEARAAFQRALQLAQELNLPEWTAKAEAALRA